jgi:uncharacterized protein YdaU (DUF1376 family)
MKYPWMPLFWGDFLANTMHLSAQEAGAYLFLIAHAWEHNGCIPCAHAQRIARVNNYHWAKVRAVLEPFFEIRGGTSEVIPPMYYHARVHQELTSADELSNKRKDAAVQMHAKRRANADGLHMHLPSHSLRESSNGKEGEVPSVQMQGNYRDKGVDYRAPPAKKSDNELKPIPDRPKAKGWVK